MVDSRSRGRDPSRLLLAVLVVIVPLGLLAARTFEFPGDRVTIGAVVVGVLLFIGALALPALLLARWQSDRESR
ncbi:hypothetical protein HYG81_08625 [Natrinema zhouii]|uniref:Uncharacterized protein n=1 Tax=Natrinema zhouii TaxID=1710539 RepID=A0A7D6CTK3_9EURY|nr:hypothetical protein [Natrinema zhouii]QLK27653.1 hypothetical protein HYG81_08625 [Natrinema zhouii]